MVLTHKLLVDSCHLKNEQWRIAGIDLSSAFDTINMHKLMKFLSSILGIKELKKIDHLLQNTDLTVKKNNEMGMNIIDISIYL